MARMTGGEALAESLVRHGVEVVFGVPGYQLDHATDPFHGDSRIRYITTRHEQGAAYMAYGYSRTGGGMGTAMVVPGPGLLNATAAIGTAYSASTSMLVVSGQIPRDMQGFNRGELHEVDDQLDCVRPITKWAARIDYPQAIPDAVQDAFRHLNTGRPRPVEIEVPLDTLAETVEVELPEPEAYRRMAPDRDSVARAARAVDAAERPVIWAGSGVFSSRASKQLERLAEYLQAPVVASYEGRGSISDRCYLSLGAYEPQARQPRRFSGPLRPGSRRGNEAGEADLQAAADRPGRHRHGRDRQKPPGHHDRRRRRRGCGTRCAA